MSRNSKGLIKFYVFIELCRSASGRYMYIMYAHVCTKDTACMHLPAASSAYTGMLNKPWAGAHVYVHARMCCTGVCTCLADSLSRVVCLSEPQGTVIARKLTFRNISTWKLLSQIKQFLGDKRI